ncbi:MAG TPA: flagellar hook-length control protein FliK, partial [Pseudomonadales bacterium]|nr:flagellar hook-length control protein FliK [Pseudomonadales bacterium]
RAPSPLDRSVSDAGANGGFADVMSQYGPEGGEKSAPAAQTATVAAAETAQGATNAGQQSPAPTPDEEAAELAALETQAEGGATLPPLPLQTGETLPLDPLGAALAAANTARALPRTDDSKTDAEATDATAAAAATIAALVLPPAVAPQPVPLATAANDATATAVAVPAPANATPAAASNNPPPPAPSDLAAAATVATADAGDADTTQIDPTAFERIRAQLDRMQRDGALTSEPRRAAPAPDTANAATANNAPQVSPSIQQTLRALLRGRDDSAPPTPVATNVRALRANADVAAAATTANPAALQAATVEATTHKDAPVDHDDPTVSVRVDAVQTRTGGADSSRDAAPARLGDLAQEHAQRFTGELADRVLVMRNQRLDGATVTLEPRDLGRIDIQVRVQADTTHIAFTAQHAAVRDALEGQLPRLRSMLEDAGLSLGAVDVAQAGARNAGGDAGSARSFAVPTAPVATDPDTPDATTAWRPRASTSLIDLHA